MPETRKYDGDGVDVHGINRCRIDEDGVGERVVGRVRDSRYRTPECNTVGVGYHVTRVGVNGDRVSGYRLAERGVTWHVIGVNRDRCDWDGVSWHSTCYVDMGAVVRCRVDGVRYSGYGTPECNTVGVRCHITWVRVDGDGCDWYGHNNRGDGGFGWCTMFQRGHVTSLIRTEVARAGARCGGGEVLGRVCSVLTYILVVVCAGGFVDVTGIGIDGHGLWGVVYGGTEAKGLVDLRCPIEPYGLVRHWIDHCRR